MRRSIKSTAADLESRFKWIERLSQPRKIPLPEAPVVPNEPKRPISTKAIERLSMPRKIQYPEQINYAFPSRPLRDKEYYEKLAQPRKCVEEENKRDSEPKLTSMKRLYEMATPLSRLQRRKFMKGDNEHKFSVSRAALQYKASAKIIKLAKPRTVPEDASKSGSKSKRKK